MGSTSNANGVRASQRVTCLWLLRTCQTISSSKDPLGLWFMEVWCSLARQPLTGWYKSSINVNEKTIHLLSLSRELDEHLRSTPWLGSIRQCGPQIAQAPIAMVSPQGHCTQYTQGLDCIISNYFILFAQKISNGPLSAKIQICGSHGLGTDSLSGRLTLIRKAKSI